jgi:hypothetical protein
MHLKSQDIVDLLNERKEKEVAPALWKEASNRLLSALKRCQEVGKQSPPVDQV